MLELHIPMTYVSYFLHFFLPVPGSGPKKKPAAGGFGADFTSNSLLAQYRPDLLHLPTTNGEHCTGDGIKMGEPWQRAVDAENHFKKSMGIEMGITLRSNNNVWIYIYIYEII